MLRLSFGSHFVKLPACVADRIPDILTYSKFTEKTDNGSIGDSTTATPEKGKEIVERCVNRILEYAAEKF